jgi:hypothetical protein
MALLEEGPEHYAAWKHLPALITEGKQDAFMREYGQPVFEYAVQHPSYEAVFNEAMSSYSSSDNALVLDALATYDFSGITHLCDVGGGHGHTLCSLLVKYPHLLGTVLERPSVVAQHELLWADKMGVGDRCTYVPGDMFQAVPQADAYMVKRVLHGRNDAECHQILAIMHRAAPRHGRVLIMEEVVPGPKRRWPGRRVRRGVAARWSRKVTARASGTAPSQPARGTLLAACESVGGARRRAERAMRAAPAAQPWHATDCLKRTS